MGSTCYPTIAAIGQPIDLAIVIIPARVVLGALEECATLGVKHAIIISSGFAEEGGDSIAMQDAIAALAKRTGMRISGPNAEGYYNQIAGIAATFSPTVDVKPDQPAGRHARSGSVSSRNPAASALRSITAPSRSALL
jgi:acyl-CoA synthetase (NDP forming)